MNIFYRKGEIIDVNLGTPPKEVKGHEQGYNRPCVVIKSFNNLGLLVLVPCTTSTPKYSLYTVVKLLKGNGGLTSDSFALCHQIRTVSFDRVAGKRGVIENRDMLKIQSVLIDSLEL